MATGDSTAQRAFWKVFEASVKATRQLKTVRAAELCERAADAAAALYGADSLVVALMRMSAVSYLHCALGAATSTSMRAVMHRTSFTHLRSTVELLQRRKAAGSLLPGRCRPEEESFDRTHCMLIMRLNKLTEDSFSQPQLRQLHACFGVSTLARTAAHAAHFIAANCVMDVSERFSTSEDTQTFLDFCADVLELFASPASDGFKPGGSVPEEASMYEQVRHLVRAAPYNTGAPGCMRAFRRVADALSELERNGAPQRRGYAKLLAETTNQAKVNDDAARAANAGRTLRTCALPSCGETELHPDQFKRCSACGGVHYCCKEHQATHWPEHKAACKAARRAAEAAAAEGAGASCG